jgi:hypothetical protein
MRGRCRRRRIGSSLRRSRRRHGRCIRFSVATKLLDLAVVATTTTMGITWRSSFDAASMSEVEVVIDIVVGRLSRLLILLLLLLVSM